MASTEYWAGNEIVCSYLLPKDFDADLVLAGRLQQVAAGSWLQELPERSMVEIHKIFNAYPNSTLRENN